MCVVASASLTAALPFRGGNAPERPSPVAWWQAAQLAMNSACPLESLLLPAASAADPAGAVEPAAPVGAGLPSSSLCTAIAGMSLAFSPAAPGNAGCFSDSRYASSACASCEGTTTPAAGAYDFGSAMGVTPGGA